MSKIKRKIAFDKSGASEIWWIIAAAVVAMIAVIVLIVWFTGAGGKLFGGLDDTIGRLNDFDTDGVSDLLDKCPCDEKELTPGQSCPTTKADCDTKLKKV